MQLTFAPDFSEFSKKFASQTPQLVSTTLIADLETPVSTFLKLHREDEPCFLLESVQGGETLGRYSIIGIKPDLLWRCKGTKAEINRKATPHDKDFEPVAENSLDSLKKLLRDCRT